MKVRIPPDTVHAKSGIDPDYYTRALRHIYELRLQCCITNNMMDIVASKSDDERKYDAMIAIQRFIDDHANIKVSKLRNIQQEFISKPVYQQFLGGTTIEAIEIFVRELIQKYNEIDVISEDPTRTFRTFRTFYRVKPKYSNLPPYLQEMDTLHAIFQDELPAFFTKVSNLHDDTAIVRLTGTKNSRDSWEISIDPSLESYYTVAVMKDNLLIADIKIPVKYVSGNQERLNVYIEALRGMLE